MQDDEDEIQLSVPLETVCYIITRAHGLRENDPTSGSDLDEGGDEITTEPTLQNEPLDPVADELSSVISDLSEDGQIDLVALMWLGRGASTWAELRGIAVQEHNDETAAYLLGTPLLADYLTEGISRLGFDCAESFAEYE